jgi:hypothetical protein
MTFLPTVLEAGLRTQQCIFADERAVAHLDEVIDLGTGGNPGFPNGGAIHGGVGLNLYSVFEDRGAGLHDFGPAAFGILGEAKAVGTDDCAVLQHDVVA